MKHISNFQDYNKSEMNEGLKNWVSSFLLLSSLGLVLGQNKQQQKEFVDNIDKVKLDGALFVDYLNKLGGSKLPLDTLFKRFKLENPSIRSGLSDVEEYLTKNGKQYTFNQKYIENAIKSSEKIKKYGYDVKDIPSKSEIEKLSHLIPNIVSLASSNIDNAIVEYRKYTNSIESIYSRGKRVITTMNDIESAISRVNNWKSEVDRLAPAFKSSGGSMTKLNALTEEFETSLSRSKDWISLSSDLNKVISYMRKVIDDYEYEQRRKREEEERIRRRKREEEEEEERIRRRKREEEEEEERSYSSSSSSSSSDSWGGFSGGSSGGGGSSGSW